MRAQLINEEPERVFALVFNKGEEVMSELAAFVNDRNLTAGHFTAIGAFRDCTLGFFDPEAKEFQRIPVNEQVTVLSLVGDIALQDLNPTIHAHTVIGKASGLACGGHLIEAHVWPTLEMILTIPPTYLKRKVDPETGLALIDMEP